MQASTELYGCSYRARVGVHWRSETGHTVICAKVMVFLVRSTFTHRLWKEAIICVIQAERLSTEM